MAEWQTAGKVRMTPKGVYSSASAYEVLDIVSNADQTISYIAKKGVPAGTSLTNTEYWAVIASVEDAIDNAADALAYIADTFSSSKNYSAGDYVIYNSKVYKFTTSHSAGAWVGTDANEIKFADELANFGDSLITNIADGSIPRSKVDTLFENTLSLADSAMQPTVYDTEGVEQDVYAYARAQDASTIQTIKQTTSFSVQDTESTSHSFTGLDAALSGVLQEAEGYADSILVDYTSFNIQVVDQLPVTGHEYTFYLVNNGHGGYDKYWYIKDENDNYTWDTFGSSSTIIAASLPQAGDPGSDYIIGTAGNYRFYKYINNTWELIAGGGSEMISLPSGVSISASGESIPTTDDYPVSEFENEYYLCTSSMTLYQCDSNGWSAGNSLVSSPSAEKDYYVANENGQYGHFRYINNAFVQVGSNSYTRDEVDEMIGVIDETLGGRISTVASDLSGLQTQFANLSNMVKDVTINTNKTALTVTYSNDSTSTIELDTGIDIDSTAYNVNDDHTLHFYDSNGNELEGLAVVITGAGGGGSQTSGSVSINRVTPANVQNVYGDSCSITYSVLAADASGDPVGSGTGTLYVNNIAVLSGISVATSVSGANNTVDVGEYLSVGSNTIKISVSVDTGGDSNIVATKTWTVNAINMYLVWNYSDSQINTSAVTDYYTPYGALEKTIYTFIDVNPVGFKPVIVTALPSSSSEDFDADADYFLYNSSSGTYTHVKWNSTMSSYDTAVGNLLNINTTTRSGVQQALTIPMQSHGSHTIVRYMKASVNGVTIETEQQVHDMVFVVSGESAPIISVSFNESEVVQYNTVQIPIVVYDPNNTLSTVRLYENSTLVSTWNNVDRTVQYWNYSPTTAGDKTLSIICGSTIKTIRLQVEALDIEESEVSGYDFRFKASEFATNDAAKSWSATYTPVGSSVQRTVSATFSNNFDWVNGGLHSEYDEDNHLRQYFVVRAGTTMTLNYNLFGRDYDPKQYGKNFKFIFKAVNCRTYDAQVLSCMDVSNGNNGVGLVMTANESTLTTANNSLKTYYYKDSYIEFETNIHPNTEYPYLQIWMDGSHDVTKLYDSSDSIQQVSPVGITIGSPNCDVYIYMIKAYPIYMTNDNELSNFIMDAPNAYEMVSRYNRNDILLESGEIDYQKLASANPDLHVLLLDLNRMTTGKKDNAVAYTVRHIYNSGGDSNCFTINNACVTVQGTSSVGYLESAGNVDINFKYGRTFTSDNVSYTTGSIAFDDGTTSTKGYAMSENSIPVDYMNVKVNVASSENANNACNVDWYNTYQPWRSPARAKNPKARDTMEFVPGVIFIRDRSGGLFGDTAGYHFYGICDIGNSKKNTKVFHDTTNPIAVCVEVSNNTSLPCLMSSLDYDWNSDHEAVVIEDGEEQKVYEFRYVEDGREEIAQSAWDRFVKFMTDYNPNLATNASIPSTTFGNYTFRGSGHYNTSTYDSDDYTVVYLYGYGVPGNYNNGIYAAADYVSDTTAGGTCYYYINYSNNYLYTSNGTRWTATEALTWVADQNNVLAGTTIGTYAGTYTTDSFNYRMAYLLEHCEEYMIMDPVIYHFIFVESFLMTDNVAKNTFWSSDDLVHWEPSKNYDSDTSLGNDKYLSF